MPAFTTRVTPLILEELARGERRVLSLVVAVGRVLERSGAVKGNLIATIKSVLHTLVASKAIVDTDGMYSLPPRNLTESGLRLVTNGHLTERTTAMFQQKQSKQSRNKAATRKNAAKVEQYLTEIEKAHGCARAWELREQLELGHITLDELRGR